MVISPHFSVGFLFFFPEWPPDNWQLCWETPIKQVSLQGSISFLLLIGSCNMHHLAWHIGVPWLPGLAVDEALQASKWAVAEFLAPNHRSTRVGLALFRPCSSTGALQPSPQSPITPRSADFHNEPKWEWTTLTISRECLHICPCLSWVYKPGTVLDEAAGANPAIKVEWTSCHRYIHAVLKYSYCGLSGPPHSLIKACILGTKYLTITLYWDISMSLNCSHYSNSYKLSPLMTGWQLLCGKKKAKQIKGSDLRGLKNSGSWEVLEEPSDSY